jgi:hypothetical protein
VHVVGSEAEQGEVRNVWTNVEKWFSANLEERSAMKGAEVEARLRIEERSLGRWGLGEGIV